MTEDLPTEREVLVQFIAELSREYLPRLDRAIEFEADLRMSQRWDDVMPLDFEGRLQWARKRTDGYRTDRLEFIDRVGESLRLTEFYLKRLNVGPNRLAWLPVGWARNSDDLRGGLLDSHAAASMLLERALERLGETGQAEASIERASPVYCSQADVARFLGCSLNTSGLLEKLQEQGRIRFERTNNRHRNKVWFLDPDEHARFQAEVGHHSTKRRSS